MKNNYKGKTIKISYSIESGKDNSFNTIYPYEEFDNTVARRFVINEILKRVHSSSNKKQVGAIDKNAAADTQEKEMSQHEELLQRYGISYILCSIEEKQIQL